MNSAAKKALDELDRLQASTDLNDDLPAINLALLLASPLAAVARAAMAYRAAMKMTDEADGAELDGADVDAVGAMDREDAAKEQLDAALDALEAAAKEVTP